MYWHLRGYHSGPRTVWPKETKHWTWQAPLTTTIATVEREPFELFAEAVARNCIKHGKSTSLERSLFLKTSHVPDARRWGDNYIEVDDSYSL